MPTLVLDKRDAGGTAPERVRVPQQEASATVTLHITVEGGTGTFRWMGYVEPDPLQDEFAELANQWRQETGHMSSPEEIAMNDAYQRIIGFGEPAIPLILKDLKRHGGHWYWALRALTGQWPVPDDAAGNMPRMKQAWLDWGVHHGHIDAVA